MRPILCAVHLQAWHFTRLKPFHRQKPAAGKSKHLGMSSYNTSLVRHEGLVPTAGGRYLIVPVLCTRVHE